MHWQTIFLLTERLTMYYIIYRLPAGAERTVPSRQIPSDLPWTTNIVCPSSCKRITIFAPAKEEDVIKQLPISLRVPVRHVHAEDIDSLYDAVREISPEQDRYTLLQSM